MANINNYFKSKEVELLKTYSLKASELCALTDEYLCSKYPIITFNYDKKYSDGTCESICVIDLFEDYEDQISIDPVDYFGDAFLNSDFMNLGKNEKAIVDEDMNVLCSAIEVDLIKRISTTDKLIDALESGDKEYIRSLSYADGTKQTFVGTWK